MTMQAEEMRSIRKEIGLSQDQLAEELGMSRKSINLMEKGNAPIEKRTALAVRQIYNTHLLRYGSHRAVPQDDDIPLGNAMVIWDRLGTVKGSAKLMVVGRGLDDNLDYSSSAGACSAEWNRADAVGQSLRLFGLFVQLTVADDIPVEEVHQAFGRIPEYREMLPHGMFPEATSFPE